MIIQRHQHQPNDKKNGDYLCSLLLFFLPISLYKSIFKFGNLLLKLHQVCLSCPLCGTNNLNMYNPNGEHYISQIIQLECHLSFLC